MSGSRRDRRGVGFGAHRLRIHLHLIAVAAVAAGGGCGWQYTEVASGFDILPGARPALASNGSVVAVEANRLLVSDGMTSSPIDLTALGLHMPPESGVPRRLVQIRDQGDLVFVASRAGVPGCGATDARGAYRIGAAGGGALTTFFEDCLGVSGGNVGHDIGMSPNGTVAFSQITNGQGAIYRGPAAGPVTVLHTGSGMLYNTGSVDINDAGRAMVQMEYSDQGLQRGILAFDTPEQAMNTLFTAIEKLGIGTQPTVAINTTGTVAFSLPSDVTINVAGTMYMFVAGVYTATPTLLNTPKSLTLIAGVSGAYCGFGSVDINDSGTVAFEARLDTGGHCTGSSVFDGIFTGPDGDADAVVVRGNAGLNAHQFFDTIVLGELSNAGAISFLTTYSEPLVDPVKVWRAHH